MGKGSSLIASRYARSLFKITSVEKADNYQKVFSAIKKLFEIPEALRILKSPIMPERLKFDLLSLALDESEADMQFRNFVKAVLYAGRVQEFPKIADSYYGLVLESRNEVIAMIESILAFPSLRCNYKYIYATLELLKKYKHVSFVDAYTAAHATLSGNNIVLSYDIGFSKIEGITRKEP